MGVAELYKQNITQVFILVSLRRRYVFTQIGNKIEDEEGRGKGKEEDEDEKKKKKKWKKFLLSIS